MKVSKSYIKFLLQLLNKEENIDIDKYQEELIVNLYLTLLSLSNIEYSTKAEQKEYEIISDFLRRLNNLKVKIQLKRKKEEIEKMSQELINQYYENINILSIYIKDGKKVENIINTMDTKKLTDLIDAVTKEKMKKEDTKEETNKRRLELIELLPSSEYYIENSIIHIKNNDYYKEIGFEEFIEIFSYLLNLDNYSDLYSNKTNQRSHDSIINNIIKLLILNEKKKEEIDKILVPMLLTYTLSLNINNNYNLDTSVFNIENIKITELYSLAANEKKQDINETTTKWRNISIPNEYLLNKLKIMIKNGMYYYKEDTFILENIENKTSDFKISTKTDKIKLFLKNILENSAQMQQ